MYGEREVGGEGGVYGEREVCGEGRVYGERKEGGEGEVEALWDVMVEPWGGWRAARLHSCLAWPTRGTRPPWSGREGDSTKQISRSQIWKEI